MSKKIKHILIVITMLFLIFVTLYSIAIFSNISFIKKWRTIYIETAMTTMSHQWLATYFIPGYIIDDVMNNAYEENKTQDELSSTWKNDKIATVDGEDEFFKKNNYSDNDNFSTASTTSNQVEKTTKEKFYEEFWEIDEDSFEDFLATNPEYINNGYDNLYIENLNEKLSIKTNLNETILVLDAKNNLIITRVKGDNFVGTLACIKKPEQLTIAKSSKLGVSGDLIEKFSNDNNAIVAMNASGFSDPNWKGNGGIVTGSLIINGVDYGNPANSYKFFGFKDDNRLYISNLSDIDVSQYKWGIQFSPALIVDGQVFVQGSFGWGLQPRSAIGQSDTGEILMLVVDGRQVGYSLGCTVGDLSDIMLLHKAYQAMNLDGGSSSIMTYNKKVITKPSSTTNAGRYLPSAFIVKGK